MSRGDYMISCPETAGPNIPGPQVSPTLHRLRPPLTAGDVAMRRVFRALLWTLALSLGFAGVAPAGEALDPTLTPKLTLGRAETGADKRPVNLFVDITSTRLVEETKLDSKRRVDLAGVPVVVGAVRQGDQAAPSVTAGIAGAYDWKLDDGWSLKADGVLSRAHVIDAGLPTAGRGGGALALGYAAGGTTLELRPSFYAGMQEDLLHHLDVGLGGRWRQDLDDGVALTATASHAWHDALDAEGTDQETTLGRLGLRFDLAKWSPQGEPGLFPPGSDLELAYEVEDTAGEFASQRRFGQSVVLLARLVAVQGWSLSGRYAFSASERGYDDADAEARRHETRQRLSLEGDWDLGSSTGAAWHMKADYGFEQCIAEDAENAPGLHTAMLSFALDF